MTGPVCDALKGTLELFDKSAVGKPKEITLDNDTFDKLFEEVTAYNKKYEPERYKTDLRFKKKNVLSLDCYGTKVTSEAFHANVRRFHEEALDREFYNGQEDYKSQMRAAKAKNKAA